MAAVARLSSYHFARQFKAATGLPPHQYVILRRVERAKGLLQAGIHLPLAEVAQRAGFSDQSQFCRHFKQLVGVTPEQFQGKRILKTFDSKDLRRCRCQAWCRQRRNRLCDKSLKMRLPWGQFRTPARIG
jgi:AraC-like DNA-binding protein